MGRDQMASKRFQGSNWPIIAISFVTILFCFQANKIKISKLSYCIFFSNYYFNKTVRMKKTASV